MRVGLVTDLYFPWIGGPSVLLRNLGRGLAARGHSVSLLAPSSTGPASDHWDGPVFVTRASSRPSPVGHGLRVCPLPGREVALWLRRTTPDVVHVHHPFPLSAAAVFRARAAGIPVVATNHTIPECSLFGIRNIPLLYRPSALAFGRWIAFLLSRCQSVATPTNTAARELRALGYRGTVDVISNGIDTDRFRPGVAQDGLREDLGLDDRPIVLYTGRLDAEKQMDTWLRAAARVIREFDAQFVVGGSGSERLTLERLSKRLMLEGHVRFVGYLPDHLFPDLYRLADVYFIASPVELQSIATLEAAASGLPVVAARAGALPELVEHGTNGYLFSPEDARSAAYGLIDLLRDPRLRRDFGHRSRTVAMQHDLARTVSDYECLLAGAARGERMGRRGERAAVASR